MLCRPGIPRDRSPIVSVNGRSVRDSITARSAWINIFVGAYFPVLASLAPFNRREREPAFALTGASAAVHLIKRFSLEEGRLLRLTVMGHLSDVCAYCQSEC